MSGNDHLKVLILFGCYLLIAGPIALYVSNALPAVKPRDIAPYLFSEERAHDHYPNLTGHGPRVIHTRGDFHTRRFLISQLDRIRSMAKMPLRFEIDVQNFTDSRHNQLQNVAVRLSNPATEPKNVPSLMLAAHYDAVEFSPGGSDDGAGVVILLEILSNLVHDLTLTFSDVHLIVLFTSGEEMGSLGAKAFIDDHIWRSDIRRFINIDATSCNEKAVLLRVKPSQLVADYARVPRPRANVLTENILALAKASTDYDVFSSEGSLFGYDFLFVLDSYIYHTSLDQPSTIKRGTLQDLGDNLHALIHDILLGHVNLRLPESIVDNDHLIYFDILSRYLITYKMRTSTIIQQILILLILVIGTIIILFDHIWHRQKTSACIDSRCIYCHFKCAFIIRIVSITIYLISTFISLIFGFLLSIFVSLVLSIARPLTWFGNSTLAVFLFGLPCLIGVIAVQYGWTELHRCVLRRWPKKSFTFSLNVKIDDKHVTRLNFDFERHLALLLIYALLLMGSTIVDHRALYMILVWSIFICPIYLLLMLVEFILRWKQIGCKLFEQRYHWLFVPFIASIFPLTHTIEITNRLVRIVIPIVIRIFPFSTPAFQDIIICCIISIPVTFSLLIFIPIIQRMKHFSRTLIFLSITFLIVFIVAYTRQPFTSTHPKVLYAQHKSRSIFKVDNVPRVPFLVPLKSRSASIIVAAYDGLPLLPVFDRFSANTGHKLHVQQCLITTYCTLDDTFNRTIAVQQIEIESVTNRTHYTIIIRHVLSYNIQVSSDPFIKFVVRNKAMKPRRKTVIDVALDSPLFPFEIIIEIERCDLSDSPFLLLLTQTMPNIVMLGGGQCETIDDHAILSIDPR